MTLLQELGAELAQIIPSGTTLDTDLSTKEIISTHFIM